MSFEESFAQLSEEELIQIVRDYEILLANGGSIGDSTLRQVAENIRTSDSVFLMMLSLAQEAHRHFALRHLKDRL